MHKETQNKYHLANTGIQIPELNTWNKGGTGISLKSFLVH